MLVSDIMGRCNLRRKLALRFTRGRNARYRLAPEVTRGRNGRRTVAPAITARGCLLCRTHHHGNTGCGSVNANSRADGVKSSHQYFGDYRQLGFAQHARGVV